MLCGAPLTAAAAVALRSEQQKDEELQEQLRAEFGSRLGKLGQLGQAASLNSTLAVLVGTPAGATLPASPLAAHLLTIATKGLCRAHFTGEGALVRARNCAALCGSGGRCNQRQPTSALACAQTLQTAQAISPAPRPSAPR